MEPPQPRYRTLGEFLDTYRLPSINYDAYPGETASTSRGTREAGARTRRVFHAIERDVVFKVDSDLLPGILNRLQCLNGAAALPVSFSDLIEDIYDDAQEPHNLESDVQVTMGTSLCRLANKVLKSNLFVPNLAPCGKWRGNNNNSESGATDFVFRRSDASRSIRHLMELKMDRVLLAEEYANLLSLMSGEGFALGYSDGQGWIMDETPGFKDGERTTVRRMLCQVVEEVIFYRCETISLSTYECMATMRLNNDFTFGVTDRLIYRLPQVVSEANDLKFLIALGIDGKVRPPDRALSKIMHDIHARSIAKTEESANEKKRRNVKTKSANEGTQKGKTKKARTRQELQSSTTSTSSDVSSLGPPTPWQSVEGIHGRVTPENAQAPVKERFRLRLSVASGDLQIAGRYWLMSPSLFDSKVNGVVYRKPSPSSSPPTTPPRPGWDVLDDDELGVELSRYLGKGAVADVYEVWLSREDLFRNKAVAKICIPSDVHVSQDDDDESVCSDEGEAVAGPADVDVEMGSPASASGNVDDEGEEGGWSSDKDNNSDSDSADESGDERIQPCRRARSEWDAEIAAYSAMQDLQGVVVPWFIGTFRGTLNASCHCPLRCGVLVTLLEKVDEPVCAKLGDPKQLSDEDKAAVIRAYARIHACNVLHGDIAIRHIRRSADGNGVRLIDFGRSRINAADEDLISEMTEVKELLGV